jgi:hypothetical protein
VKNTLWPVDANVVLRIPMREDMDVFWAWNPDPKGIFTANG